MPGTDLTLLTDAARASGDIARRYFRTNAQIWDKANNAGPVTEADLAVNTMLHSDLRAARPDYGWLSEETEDDPTRLHHDRVFIVDPIDGTRAFIEGSNDWAHSIAVAERGQIIAAAIYLPMRDLMFAAHLGGGATLNGDTIRVTTQKDPAQTTVLATKHNLKPEYWHGGTPPPFKRSYRSSLAWRLCLVAQGRYDAMLTLRPTWEWDIAAGALIVDQAGGTATDQTGAPLSFNAPHPQAKGVVAGGAICTTLRDGLARPTPAP